MHCPPKNLNLRIKTEPVMVRADATVCIRFLGQIYVNKNRTYTVQLHPDRQAQDYIY